MNEQFARAMDNSADTDASQQELAICSICEKQVVDDSETEDGDDAVFCDGECQCWLHRTCVCLPKSEFAKLKTEEPFHCPRCSSNMQMKIICELREAVAALTVQVQELQTNGRSNAGETWATVADRGSRQQGSRSATPQTNPNSNSNTGIAVTEVPTLEEVPVIRMEGCSLTHGQGNRRKLTHKGKACQTKVPALKSRQTVSGSTVPW